MKQSYIYILIITLFIGGCGFFVDQKKTAVPIHLKTEIVRLLRTANVDSVPNHFEKNSLKMILSSGLLAAEHGSGRATSKFSELCFNQSLNSDDKINEVIGFLLKAKSERLLNQPAVAEKSLNQAQSIAIQNKLNEIIPYIHAEKVLIQLQKNNLLQANQLIQTINEDKKELKQSLQLRWMMAQSSIIIKIKLHQYRVAKELYPSLLNTAKLTNSVDKIAEAKIIYAKIFMGLHVSDSVSFQIHEAQTLADISENNVLKAVCLETMIDWNKQNKDWSLVSENQEKLLILQKQMLISDPIDEVALDYLSNLKLNLSEKEKTDLKQTTERNKYLLIIVALVLILVSTFLIFSYRLSRKMKLANLKLLAKNREIHRKNGEIEKKSEELNRLNRVLEAKIQERTQKLIHQNSKLREVAYYNSHRVRGPLSTIMGLVELYQGKMLDDIQLLMREIDNHSKELDRNLFEINEVLRKEDPSNN